MGLKSVLAPIIGANALVTLGSKIPAGSLVLGLPAKVKRALTLDEQKVLPAEPGAPSKTQRISVNFIRRNCKASVSNADRNQQQ
jgi:carbonic anhydrase/acetyltransferase-like protein (isoleucine patch superfamily)